MDFSVSAFENIIQLITMAYDILRMDLIKRIKNIPKKNKIFNDWPQEHSDMYFKLI